MLLHGLTVCALALNVIAHPYPQDDRLPYSLRMANSIISRHQGILASTSDRSNLLQAGFTQKTFRQLFQQYTNHSLAPVYTAYIQSSVNSVIQTVSNATLDITYPLDRLSSGNGLIYAAQESANESYKNAYEALRTSVDLQPRNDDGSLWYYTYPNYTYLDGMYSLAPFLTLYSGLNTSRQSTPSVNVDDVICQLSLAWNHTYQPDSGLLVHGYDASKRASWAITSTGASRYVWGRSLGWYCMALLDTLDLLPVSADAAREWILEHFRVLMTSVVEAANAQTGAWWQIMDQPGREGNYIESSASAMFVYSLLKGARLGYLEPSSNHGMNNSYTTIASRAYEYIADTFVVENGNGTLGWNGTVSVCSLNSTATYEVCIAHFNPCCSRKLTCHSSTMSGNHYCTIACWVRQLSCWRLWSTRGSVLERFTMHVCRDDGIVMFFLLYY
jgi:rhamnogalacturonyl hydrolase YesR